LAASCPGTSDEAVAAAASARFGGGVGAAYTVVTVGSLDRAPSPTTSWNE
jgi:hypothetical protein